MAALELDHVGIYVRDMEAALTFWCDRLGLERPVVEDRPEHGIRLARVRLGAVDLELIEGEVGKTRLRHMKWQGPGVYHLGVRVHSTDGELGRLRAAGVTSLDDAPQEGDCMRVAFLAPEDGEGVMVELVERTGRKT